LFLKFPFFLKKSFIIPNLWEERTKMVSGCCCNYESS
jgi:hypothetical protein